MSQNNNPNKPNNPNHPEHPNHEQSAKALEIAGLKDNQAEANIPPAEEPKKEVKQSRTTFVLADDGSICLSSDVAKVNANIKKNKEIAEAELERIEAQNKKLGK